MPTPGSISAALDPTAPAPYKQGREFVQRVVLRLTDNYVAGGVVVNLMGLGLPGGSPPFAWTFYPQDSDTYEYIASTTRALGKLVAMAGATAHTDDTAWAEATLKAEFRYQPL